MLYNTRMTRSSLRLARRVGLVLGAAAITGLLAACGGPSIDLQKTLKVTDVSSGWYDTGIVEGKHKLVPSITFKLDNQASAPLVSLQVNSVFRRVGETDEWGNAYKGVAGSDGLAAGATTNALTLQSPLGYTGTEAPSLMLQNHLFVDAQVTIFAKYGSSQWTKIGDFPIKRALLNGTTGQGQ
jgi:hypothetical protein